MGTCRGVGGRAGNLSRAGVGTRSVGEIGDWDSCDSVVGVSDRLFLAPMALSAVSAPLTFRDVVAELGALRLARPNQCGKPCRRLKPPGGNRSSSVALTVSVSVLPVLNV